MTKTQTIRDMLQLAGTTGYTADEIGVATGFIHGSITSILRSLGENGVAYPNGIRRNTQLGNPANVWVYGSGEYRPRINSTNKPLPRRIEWIETKTLDFIRTNPGATAWDVSDGIEAALHTVKPQITRLVYLGRIRVTGKTAGPYGRLCSTYEVAA